MVGVKSKLDAEAIAGILYGAGGMERAQHATAASNQVKGANFGKPISRY
jgi:hypothetical protein